MGQGSAQLQRFFRAIAIAIGFAAMFGATACVSIYRDHGYVPLAEDLDQIRPGVDTRSTVQERIGTPGASGVLDESGYYYIATRMRHFGATQPKPVSRELVAITFGPGDRVESVQRYGLEDGRVIELQRRVTDSGSTDSSFLRQLLGNLGRFNPGAFLDG